MLLLLELWAVLRLQCLMCYRVAMLVHAGCGAAGGAVIAGQKCHLVASRAIPCDRGAQCATR